MNEMFRKVAGCDDCPFRSDDGELWECVYNHNKGIIQSMYLWNNMLFLGDNIGGIYKSENHGVNFTIVLQMENVCS